jgi:predicted transcriptional regulator
MRIESLTERNRALEMAADALRDQIKLLKEEALVSRAKKEH